MKAVVVDGTPRMALLAVKATAADEKLPYNYIFSPSPSSTDRGVTAGRELVVALQLEQARIGRYCGGAAELGDVARQQRWRTSF